MQYNAAFEIKNREDFIGVFSECFGIISSPRLSQVRRRQNLWAISSHKIGENDQDLGCFFVFFNIVPVLPQLSQVRHRRLKKFLEVFSFKK